MVKSDIIALRRKIFSYLKKKALSYETNLSKEFVKYHKDQVQFSNRDFFPSSMDELQKSIIKSQVVYLGDFHTFDQNLRNVLRILKVLIKRKKKCILAVEMVDAKFQFYIDTYLKGHLTDLEFLECIDYHESWRFPWTHYKLIFEMAKSNYITIIGLNTEGSLSERDEFASKILANSIKATNVPHVVLYGEVHIAHNKIPKRVAEYFDYDQFTHTIIHQNLDEVYWKQVDKNKSNKFVKFSENEFCLNSAPPWIKYESMVYWYENLCDDPDFDIHEYIIENGKKIFGEDIHENFIIICKEMIQTMGLSIDNDYIEDFNLYDHSGLDVVEKRITQLKSKKLLSFYNYLIETGQSFIIPGSGSRSIYCSSYSLNRISYLAGIHISHYYLKQSEADILKSNNFSHNYILFVYKSMFAYFFSKIINPHRKCDMYLDWKMKSTDLSITKQERKINLLSMSTIDNSNIAAIFEKNNLKTIYSVAQLTGHMLGEQLYNYVVNSKKKIGNLSFIKSFLTMNVDLKEFERIKEILLPNKQYKMQRKRFF